MTTEPLPTPHTSRCATAKVQLGIAGQTHEFSIPVTVGPARVVDLLPAARELANQEAAANIARAESAGKRISCCAGCGACCRQLVAISVVEAQGLADLVDRLPAERQAVIRARFAEAVARLEAAGLLDSAEPPGRRVPVARETSSLAAALRDVAQRYFRLQIACPFLEDESCSIYAERPMVCRVHHVTSPAENCSRLFEAEVEKLEPAFHMGEVLCRTAHRSVGADNGMIPLVLSLEWSAAHAESLAARVDGEQLLGLMFQELGPQGS